jgi:hypothetical protein
MKEENVIMYDSPEAATYVKNIEGWIDKDRRFFGKGDDGERMARYSSCTHKTCDCGNIMQKGYTKCEDCRRKASVERYNALPFKEWDLSEPVCTWDGDKYFFNIEDLEEYMEENELTEIPLLLCEANKYRKIEADYWADVFPDDSDGELPKEMQEALDNLNAVIDKMPAASYAPSRIRTTYTLNPTTND